MHLRPLGHLSRCPRSSTAWRSRGSLERGEHYRPQTRSAAEVGPSATTLGPAGRVSGCCAAFGGLFASVAGARPTISFQAREWSASAARGWLGRTSLTQSGSSERLHTFTSRSRAPTTANDPHRAENRVVVAATSGRSTPGFFCVARVNKLWPRRWGGGG